MDASISSLSSSAPSLSRTSSTESAAPLPRLGQGLRLIPESRIDRRSDEEIIAQLKSYRAPTASDKNVWAFWHSGFDNMAPWTQRNVIGWVRRLGPDWTVRVLDRVPGSPVNVSRYVDPSFLPEAFNADNLTGPHAGPHAGDLVRLPLLYLYGGVWLDVGMMLFRHLEDICWNIIEDPSNACEIVGFTYLDMPLTTQPMLNGFIAAKRGNGFIKRWHDIFLALWQGGATEATGFHNHPLLRHLPLLVVVAGAEAADKPNLGPNVQESAPGTWDDYLAQCRCFDRLIRLIDPNDGFNGLQYWEEKICLFDAIPEMYSMQVRTAWNGIKQFELLSLKRDCDDVERDDEKYQLADLMVDEMLANSATMKLSHGNGSMETTLAALWDDPKHHHKDVEPGTFAAYLRYASVHCEQTRGPMTPAKKRKPPAEEIVHVGVLEPVQGRKRSGSECR
ncbi:hypothetical protein VTO42DRAFT_4075 [Malbranchea cinnamomea]